MLEQEVLLSGIGNARELGGYKIGSKRIKNDTLIRTAYVNGADQSAIDKLEKELHIQYIVDFRMSMEAKFKPDPVIKGSKNISLPLLEAEDVRVEGADMKDIRKYTDFKSDRMQMFEMAYAGGQLSEKLYVDFLTKERGKNAFREFFKALLSLDEGRGIIWHCTDGKDRTGCATMLVLYALGASRDMVMEDYLLTNKYNEDKLQKAGDILTNNPMPPEKRDAFYFFNGGVIESFMANAIDTLEKQYGSVAAYLEKEIQVGDRECDRLQEMFLI